MSLWFTALPFLHLADFSARESCCSARFEKDTRYYVIRMEKDLLDDWVIIIINGRINSRLGQSRTMAFQNFNDAYTQFCEMGKVRHQRGYHLKTFGSNNPLLLQLLTILPAIGIGEQVSDISKKIKRETPEKLRTITRAKKEKMPQKTCEQISFGF